MAKERHREKERKRDRKGETLNHLSIHQWVRSAIFASHQLTSPIGFPFLKLPPPPCAVLLVLTCDSRHVIHIDETCKLHWKSSLPSLECNRFVSVWLCATYCAQSQISGRDLCRWGVGLRCGWALVAAKMSPIPEEVPGHSETLSQH